MRLRSRPHATTDLRIVYRRPETRSERLERVAKQRLLAARGLADAPIRAWARPVVFVAWSLLLVALTLSATRLVVSGGVRGGPVYQARSTSSQTCTGADVTSMTNLNTRLGTAADGDVLCLTSGVTGTYSGTNGDHGSPGVTIKAKTGNTPTFYIDLSNVTTADWMIFDAIKIDGATICAPANHITFQNSEVSNELDIAVGAGGFPCSGAPAMANSAILLDNIHVTRASDPFIVTGHEGAIQFDGDDNTSATPVGVTIEDSLIDPPCGDGIQFSGARPGILIQRNDIHVSQEACDAVFPGPGGSPHTDGVQFVGGCCTTFDRNFIHDSQTGIVNFDGTPANVVITNNVFKNIHSIGGSEDAIVVCAASNLLVEHNTVDNGDVLNCWNHNSVSSTNSIFRNNILPGPVGVQGTSTFAVNNYNWCLTGTCPGANSLNGTPAPSWVGGAAPTTYAGFKLTSGTRGTGVGSDGTDIGVNP